MPSWVVNAATANRNSFTQPLLTWALLSFLWPFTELRTEPHSMPSCGHGHYGSTPDVSGQSRFKRCQEFRTN
jgi:hypothetical protein